MESISTAMLSIGIHAMIGGDEQGIARLAPTGDIVGEKTVHRQGATAILLRVGAEAVPGIVNAHRVNQHKIGLMGLSQRLSVGKQVGVWVKYLPNRTDHAE